MRNTFAKLRIGVLLFVANFLGLLLGNAYSFPDIPNDNLAYPALLVSKENLGSGFFFNKEDATYLVTARHVLFKETTVELIGEISIPESLRHKAELVHDKKGKVNLTFWGVMSEKEKQDLIKSAPNCDIFKDAIQLLYQDSQKLKLKSIETTLYSYPPKITDEVNELELPLTNLFAKGLIKYHPSSDVAVIKVGTTEKSGNQIITKLSEGIIMKQKPWILGVAKDNFKLFDDVLVGNGVFVFGYPTSISKTAWLDIKLPLLRKGIIAGKNKSLKAIILDCPLFPGNSGGLVIEVERVGTEEKFKAIGVVTELIPYQLEWVQNSGYSIAVPMDFVEELIKGQIR
jgi:S1-C subfamily serine protease